MKTIKNTKNTKNTNTELAAAMDSLEAYITRFEEYMGKSMAALVEAAKCYSHAVDQFGHDAESAFGERFPHFARKDWQMLVRIARKELSPKVFVMTSAYMVNKVGALPYETQVACLGEIGEEPKELPVLTRGSVQMKPINAMNATELTSVVDTQGGRIRDIDEQVAAFKLAQEKRAAMPAWEIDDGVMAVHKPCVIKGDEIVRLYDALGEMLGKAKRGKKARAA